MGWCLKGGGFLSEYARKTCGKIQSAKHWLTKAEQHIERDAPVRGRIDILLAEAELKSIKNHLQTAASAKKGNFVSHFISFGIAVVIAIVFGALLSINSYDSTALLTKQQSGEIHQQQVVSTQAYPAQAVQVQNSAKASPEVGSAVSLSQERQVVHGSTQPAGKDPSVSSDEMQRLIRAAGQSLRGQTKP